jgi:signal transduction histidine kinase
MTKAGQPLATGMGRRFAIRIAIALPNLTLVQRFALACLVILVAGALLIGSWVAREIESGVIRRTAAITALYVDSFVSPHLTGLETDGGLDDASIRSLAALLDDTALGRKIVSFKVWSSEGEILFATHAEQIGQRYAITGGLRDALQGSVHSHLSDLKDEESRLERERWPRLVETYLPVLARDGTGVGAVEFYQVPDDLLAEIRRSQRTGWGIVGASTVAMYAMLVGLVAGASKTITRQNKSLQVSVEQQTKLQARIRALNQRLRRAAGAKAQTDEEVLRRLAQDLHDGPAQDLALALLRIGSVDPGKVSDEERQSLSTVEFAVRHALDGVRSLTTALRLPEIEGLNWIETARKAALEHERRTGVVVHVTGEEVATRPATPQQIALYRVIQEALSNASLHSGTREHRVTLSFDERACILRIEDTGLGFDAGAGAAHGGRANLGIKGMRERIELLGGTFSVTSVSGQGTAIIARIPFAEDDHAT